MTLGHDDYIHFHIVRAPLQRVLPLCVGLIRAEHWGAVLSYGVTEAPLRYHDERRGRSDHFDFTSGYLVSTPLGRPDLTIIECPPLSRLERGLERLDPTLEDLIIWSEVESQKVQAHGFELRQDGQRVRFVQAEKGVEAPGLDWIEDGPMLPFEEPLAYQQRSVPKRMTRALLGQYAKAQGVDTEQHFVNRQMENSVLITSGQTMSADDTRPRTTAFQDVYERALALGIGQPEFDETDHAYARQMFADTSTAKAIHEKASRAWARLNKKTDLDVAQIVAWFEKHHARLDEALGPDVDPHPLEIWAADTATKIDPTHPDSERLRRNKASWESTRDVIYRLRHLLPDEQDDQWPSQEAIRTLVRSTSKEHRSLGLDLDQELINRFRQLCSRHGIQISVEAVIPSRKDAMASRFLELMKKAGRPLPDLSSNPDLQPVIFVPPDDFT